MRIKPRQIQQQMDTPINANANSPSFDALEYELPISTRQRTRLLHSVVPLVDKYGGAGLSDADLQWEFDFDVQLQLEAMSNAIARMEVLWLQVVPGIVATLSRIRPHCSFSVRRNVRWSICRAQKETNILREQLVLAFGHYRSTRRLHWTLFVYLVNLPSDFDVSQLPVYQQDQLDYDSDSDLEDQQSVQFDSDSSSNEENYPYY